MACSDLFVALLEWSNIVAQGESALWLGKQLSPCECNSSTWSQGLPAFKDAVISGIIELGDGVPWGHHHLTLRSTVRGQTIYREQVRGRR